MGGKRFAGPYRLSLRRIEFCGKNWAPKSMAIQLIVRCNYTQLDRYSVVTWQGYFLMMVLTSTTDKDAVVWKGLMFIFCFYLIIILEAASFVAGTTIANVTGMFHRAQLYYLCRRHSRG